MIIMEIKTDDMPNGLQVLQQYQDQDSGDLFKFVALENMIEMAVQQAFILGQSSTACEVSPKPISKHFISEAMVDQIYCDLNYAKTEKIPAIRIVDYLMLNSDKIYWHSWDIENVLKSAFNSWPTESSITRMFRTLGCIAIKPEKGKKAFVYLHPKRNVNSPA